MALPHRPLELRWQLLEAELVQVSAPRLLRTLLLQTPEQHIPVASQLDDVVRPQVLPLRRRVPVTEVDQHALHVPPLRVREDVEALDRRPDLRVEPQVQ